MFYKAKSFNQPLNDWDVASVSKMDSMFMQATAFNQPLNDWNVASVTFMERMFQEAFIFNQPLNDWNVAFVNTMINMFGGATKFNQCLSTWADKSPPNLFVNGIFGDSGCPDNANPNPLVGPWCQGEDEQCIAPSESPSSSL